MTRRQIPPFNTRARASIIQSSERGLRLLRSMLLRPKSQKTESRSKEGIGMSQSFTLVELERFLKSKLEVSASLVKGFAVDLKNETTTPSHVLGNCDNVFQEATRFERAKEILDVITVARERGEDPYAQVLAVREHYQSDLNHLAQATSRSTSVTSNLSEAYRVASIAYFLEILNNLKETPPQADTKVAEVLPPIKDSVRRTRKGE